MLELLPSSFMYFGVDTPLVSPKHSLISHEYLPIRKMPITPFFFFCSEKQPGTLSNFSAEPKPDLWLYAAATYEEDLNKGHVHPFCGWFFMNIFVQVVKQFIHSILAPCTFEDHWAVFERGRLGFVILFLHSPNPVVKSNQSTFCVNYLTRGTNTYIYTLLHGGTLYLLHKSDNLNPSVPSFPWQANYLDLHCV